MRLYSTDIKHTPGSDAAFSETHTDRTIMFQLAFEHLFHANIVYTISDGKIIMANRAAIKLTGYTEKQLLSQPIDCIFDTTSPGFRKMIKQQKVEGNGIVLVTVRKKNGNTLQCKIGFSVFRDAAGIENSITSIYDRSYDITQQQEIDKEKDKVVAGNIIIAKLKQKKIDIKNDKVVADNIVLAKSKQKKIDIKNDKVVADNIVLAKSKQKKIDIKKEKIVANNIMIAKSKQHTIDLLNEAHEASFILAFNSFSEVLFDCDISKEEVKISNGYETSFGYKIAHNMMPLKDWLSHIHPDDKEAMELNYNAVLASSDMEWKYNYRLFKADNTIVNICTNAIILRKADGTAFRIIGSMHDISKQVVLEERLEQEIKLKEKQIAEAAEDAKHAERSDLGKELHDNINQLLGASRLYLEMAKQGGENIEMYLTRSSEYTLTAIEEIRRLTKGLTTDTIKTLGLCEAIEHIVRDTMEISKVKITCDTGSFKENSVDHKFKLNVFRIVQEQLNNILKYAKATKVSIGLQQSKKSVILKISDNGIGFDTTKKRTGNGINNIKSRAQFYNGTADFISNPGGGCVLSIPFPLQDQLVNMN